MMAENNYRQVLLREILDDGDADGDDDDLYPRKKGQGLFYHITSLGTS